VITSNCLLVYLGDLLCIYVNLRAFCQFLWTMKLCVGVQYVCEVVEMMSDKRRVMVLLVAYIKHILVSPRACCLESTALNHHSLN